MADEINIFDDIESNIPVNIFDDIEGPEEETQTPLPGMFDKERYTDKKKFIGDSEFLEDYELVDPDKMDFFDKFVFQTLGGNEEVYRQKKTDFGENFMRALQSRDTAAIIGSLGGYEGVKKLAANALKTTFKKNPVGTVLYAIGGGTLGATAMEMLHDRVKGFITGEEETVEEIWEKVPQDLKRNLTFESFGVGIGAIPFLFKRILMTGKKGAEGLKKIADKFGIDFAPLDLASPIAKTFLRLAGMFPMVAGPVKKFVTKRGGQLEKGLDDTLYALAPTGKTQSEVSANVIKLAGNTYKNFRTVVGKQYNNFLDLAVGKRGGSWGTNAKGEQVWTPGKKILDANGVPIKFDINITPLRNPKVKLDADGKWVGGDPYIMDVARKIINDAQQGGKKQLVTTDPGWSEAYSVALNVVDKFGGNKFLDVRTLRQYITNNIKKATKRSQAGGEGGASIGELVELKNGINNSFENLNLSSVDANLADEIVAQYKIATNMYKNGWEEGGKFFEGKPLFERAMAGQFNKVEKGIFESGLSKEGKKYYDEFIKDIIKFNSKEGMDDLYKLVGKDDEAFGAIIRTYLDDAIDSVTKVGTGKNEFDTTFNFLKIDPQELIKKLGFRTTQSAGKNAYIPVQEEALTRALDILNKGSKNFNVSGKDFRQFLDFMSQHKSIKVPDVNAFIQRTAVFGGLSAIAGNYLGFLSIGEAGMAGGMSLVPTLGARGIARALSNPANTKILFDTLDTSLSYFQRYTAGIRLLDLTRTNLNESITNAADDAKEGLLEYKEGFDLFYEEVIKNAPKDENAEEPIEFLDDSEDSSINEEVVIEDAPVDTVGTPTLDVPQPDANFNMAAVVEPLPGPSSDRQEPLQLDDVGLSLFNANQGGIASLCGDKKPQQMVA